MPCDSEYLRPTWWEVEYSRAARLLKYVLDELLLDVPDYVLKNIKSPNLDGEKCVVELCRVLKSLGNDELNSLVYNPRSRESRDLANWWEDHLEADRVREEGEVLATKRRAAIKSAMEKLTPDEIKALGIKL